MDEILRAKRQANAGSGTRAITIRGAREHNLKNVDLEIPRDRLVVFTGLAGIVAAPGSLHPLTAFTALLCIAVAAGASG